MKQMKYPDLAALKTAYDSGELSRRDFVMLDNDACTVYPSHKGERFAGDKVFDLHPADLLEQALRLLGIPFERA